MICCSTRDKQGFSMGRPPWFEYVEVEVQLETPVMVAFAPLHRREAFTQRRLALASQHEVNVYSLPGDDLDSEEPPQIFLTHRLNMDAECMVTAILFGDQDDSGHLVVATRPVDVRQNDEHIV